MRTQSIDTHPETERVMIELIRRASMSKRFRLVQSLTQSALWSRIHAWLERHLEASEQVAATHIVSCTYGAILAQRVQKALERGEHWHVQPIDLIATMLPALQAFDQLHVPSYLAGSIASSLHGMQQLARDIDLVVDLPEHAIAPLQALLKPYYVLDEDEIWQAVRSRTSFSLIHLDSLMKVDVILPKREAFDIRMHQLVGQHFLDENAPPIWLASACEMILFKLRRYQQDEQSRTDSMCDDAEWNDVLGMLKVQAVALDLSLLEAWAATLDLTQTWWRSLIDAGLRDG
jgi:hypothetical protein